MKAKKLLAMLLASSMVMALGVTALADEEETDTSINIEGSGDVTLELEYGITGEQLNVFKKVVQGFTDETGIGITITQPGNSYENAMKTRMASGDLPDIWVTHGWSVMRYSEYMEPLEDQDWYSQIDESLLPSITDDDIRLEMRFTYH